MGERITVECWKCGGKGWILPYSGTANGKCFHCWGAGTVRVERRELEANAERDMVLKASRLVDDIATGEYPAALIASHADAIAAEMAAADDTALCGRVLRRLARFDLSGTHGSAAHDAGLRAARAIVAAGRRLRG